MSTQPNPVHLRSVSEKSLWFGFAAAVPAWVVTGIVDAILAWHVCMGHELDANAVYSNTGMRVLLGIVTFGLLAVAVAGGIVSFRNWRKMAGDREFVSAEGRERMQYMALSGVLVSTVLAVGIVWFSIPIYLLGLCSRTR